MSPIAPLNCRTTYGAVINVFYTVSLVYCIGIREIISVNVVQDDDSEKETESTVEKLQASSDEPSRTASNSGHHGNAVTSAAVSNTASLGNVTTS